MTILIKYLMHYIGLFIPNSYRNHITVHVQLAKLTIIIVMLVTQCVT